MDTPRSVWHIHIAATLSAFISFITMTTPAEAEVRTISATGEYRLQGKETPEQARQLALQAAQRVLMERVWDDLLNVPELKSLGVTRSELEQQIGLVQVVEGETRSQLEGQTQIIRADLKAQVDTAVVLRRIKTYRQFQNTGC